LYLFANYLLAGLIGAAVGAVELLGRYKDNPWAALREPSALLYLCVNAGASLLAFHCVTVFEIRMGIAEAGGAAKLALLQVFLAGLSAMAFFRTSLFTVKVADVDLPVGPGLVLQILLNVTDRSVDRGRALPRAGDIPRIMAGVDFAKGAEALPSFCFGIMQNVGTDEQSAARSQVAIISQSSLSNTLKANLLGLLIVNLVGKDVLESAVTALREEIAI
jgi:hypothetical protein